MKKILLLISCLIISVATAFAATGQLNAYAYGASYAYNPETQTFAVNWSMQAEASAVRIMAVDTHGNKYVLKQYGKTRADAYNSTFSIWDAVDAVPTNEDLRVEIEVKTASRGVHEPLGKNRYCTRIPYSVDIDNHPYSECFGLIYITHMNNVTNKGECGIQVFDQWVGSGALRKVPTGLQHSDNWYYQSHGVPHMVRVIPDGSGRLLVSSSDRSQETHLWLLPSKLDSKNIPLLDDWKTIITSKDWKSSMWTNHGTYGKDDKMANASIDIRENGNYWDILLLAASFSSTTEGHSAGQAYSGVYRVAKNSQNLTGGSYIPYTAPTADYEDHAYIGDEYVGSTLNATANFDNHGGVFYNAHNEQSNREPNGSALIYRTANGEFIKYTDGNYLKRKNLATKGVRFNKDFSKIAIAQGKYMTNELRIYDVVWEEGKTYPSLKNGVSVDLIEGDAKAYIHDIAWDYAHNIYATVRNSDNGINGLYLVATNLGNEAITTPVGGQPFRVECQADQFYTITLNQQDGTGTLTGAGRYASCTKVTVTAKPDNQYKFIKWTDENGNEVSKSPTYTFRATKNRALTAVFQSAVYNNITWWNLFQNGEDIGDNSSSTNERLWRLFQVGYNSLFTDHSNLADVNGKHQVMYFLHTKTRPTNSTESNTTIRSNVEKYMDNSSYNTLFGWLGTYIEEFVGVNDINEYNGGYNIWGFYLQAFFNRTTVQNADLATLDLGSVTNQKYRSVNFSSKGLVSSWRPYWTDKVCGLPSTMTYNDAMPTEWKTATTCPGGSIAGITPSHWYKWNHVDSEQNGGHSDTHIRAWRKDGVKGPIITRVEEDNLRLYNTYVKKHIQEDDPTPDMSGDYPQDATNSDIFRLLFNKTWHPYYKHCLTITRKVQGGMYNTICFPFTVQLGQNGSIPNDNPFKQATFWEYIGTDSKYNESGEPVTILKFEQETAVLEAGVPYLVWSKDDITQEEMFREVLCDSVPKTVPAREGSPVPITFVGTINPTEVPAGSIILVADNRLAQTTTKGEMKGMRGYFTIDPMWAAEIGEQAADGRVYLSMHKPTTTSIPVAPEAEQQTKPEVRKIMRDGQIYILRGDEVYTITGHRVR